MTIFTSPPPGVAIKEAGINYHAPSDEAQDPFLNFATNTRARIKGDSATIACGIEVTEKREVGTAGEFSQMSLKLDAAGLGTITLTTEKSAAPVKNGSLGSDVQGEIKFHISHALSKEAAQEIRDIFKNNQLSSSRMLNQLLGLLNSNHLETSIEVSNTYLSGLNLALQELSHATLNNVVLHNVGLDGVDFSHSKLHDVRMYECQSAHLNLDNAVVSGKSEFIGVDLHKVSAKGTTIEAGIPLRRTDLRQADLSGIASIKDLLLNGSDKEIVQLLAQSIYSRETTIFSKDPGENEAILNRLDTLSRPIDLGSSGVSHERLIQDITESSFAPTLEVIGGKRCFVIPMGEREAVKLIPAPEGRSKVSIEGIGGITQKELAGIRPDAAFEELLKLRRKLAAQV